MSYKFVLKKCCIYKSHNRTLLTGQFPPHVLKLADKAISVSLHQILLVNVADLGHTGQGHSEFELVTEQLDHEGDTGLAFVSESP